MTSTEKDCKTNLLDATEIINFWQEAGPEKWFANNPDFDAQIQTLYSDAPDKTLNGTYDEWLGIPEKSLALILILDQFPRNIYRNSSKAYAYDEAAKQKASNIIAKGFDQSYPLPLKRFFYLPYMHSEKLEDQLYCIELCEKANDPDGVKFGQTHLDVIEKFNRFPHRNEVLGRQSTPEELDFLIEGGFQA
jgi:uncharacterized protein (DUF924 family)